MVYMNTSKALKRLLLLLFLSFTGPAYPHKPVSVHTHTGDATELLEKLRARPEYRELAEQFSLVTNPYTRTGKNVPAKTRRQALISCMTTLEKLEETYPSPLLTDVATWCSTEFKQRKKLAPWKRTAIIIGSTAAATALALVAIWYWRNNMTHPYVQFALQAREKNDSHVSLTADERNAVEEAAVLRIDGYSFTDDPAVHTNALMSRLLLQELWREKPPTKQEVLDLVTATSNLFTEKTASLYQPSEEALAGYQAKIDRQITALKKLNLKIPSSFNLRGTITLKQILTYEIEAQLALCEQDLKKKPHLAKSLNTMIEILRTKLREINENP